MWIKAACDQFEVQIQVNAELAHFGCGKGVAGQQRRGGRERVHVFEEGFRFADGAVFSLEVRHFSQWRQGLIGLTQPDDFFLKRQVFLQQREFDFVVVVTGRKATQCQHVFVSLR